MSGELLSIILLLGVHIVALGYLFWYALTSDGLTLREMLRGDDEEPDDDFPYDEPPGPVISGGGLPLPDTDPSSRRLRGPVPIGDGYPLPPRRPDHAPDRVPSGDPAP